MRGRITALVAAVAAAAGTASAVKWARGRKDHDELEPEVSGTPLPPRKESAPAPAPTATPAAAPTATPAADPTPAADATPAPRAVDDLTAIKGLGKVRAAKLVAAGVTSYAQIAAWTDDDIARMGLACDTSPGQINRADWVGQAKALTEG